MFQLLWHRQVDEIVTLPFQSLFARAPSQLKEEI